MKNHFVCILVIIIIQAALFKGNAEVNVPPYPPQQWRISVTFNFSSDVLLTFLDTKPKDGDFLCPEMLSLWLSEDFEIRGSNSHPVLTRKLPEHGFGGPTFEALGYVRMVDQSTIYSNACRVLQSFRYTDTFIHTNNDASGIDISIDVEINGRSMSAKYDKLHAKDNLPADVAALLALLRRSLPPSYESLFDYLRVAKLPSLTGDLASQYRRCQLHNEWMKIGDVSIVYGLLCTDETYSKAREQHFPNAHTYSSGGCVVTPNSPKGEKSLYCESCRKAESEWRKKHEKKP